MDWLDFSQQDLVRIVAHVAGSLLTGALLVWFFRRAQRRPARRRGHSDVRILEYGPALRWLFPVFAIGFGILYVVTTEINPAGIEDPGGKLFWPTVLIEAIALVGILETWVVKIELSEYGIVSRSPWTGTRQLNWGQIEDVSFSEGWQWFVVRGVGGAQIYLHVLLSGLQAFHATLLECVESRRLARAAPYLQRLHALSPGG